MPDTETPDKEFVAALGELLLSRGLASEGESITFLRLSGGVSSDLWRIDTRDSTLCVKRALPKLKTSAHWEVPVARYHSEVTFHRHVHQHVRENAGAPKVLAVHPSLPFFVMDWYPTHEWENLETMLLAGRAARDSVGHLATLVAGVHSGFARSTNARSEFMNRNHVETLCLEPHLRHVIAAHPDLQRVLEAKVAALRAHERCVMHGDFSPSNVLVHRSEARVILLDAECACIGDPAFDVALFLSHLLVTRITRSDNADELRRIYEEFVVFYLTAVDWEERRELESRASDLLPALMLARVEGRSPVEYLDADAQRRTRKFGRELLVNDASPSLEELSAAWDTAISGTSA